jgi:hypothetical protein
VHPGLFDGRFDATVHAHEFARRIHVRSGRGYLYNVPNGTIFCDLHRGALEPIHSEIRSAHKEESVDLTEDGSHSLGIREITMNYRHMRT